jgi:hypothetical protein
VVHSNIPLPTTPSSRLYTYYWVIARIGCLEAFESCKKEILSWIINGVANLIEKGKCS